jgi:hypothetical protein
MSRSERVRQDQVARRQQSQKGRGASVQGVVGHRRREAASGRACHSLSETMKFESRLGRHEAAEWERGGSAGSGEAPSQAGEQSPIVIGHSSSRRTAETPEGLSRRQREKFAVTRRMRSCFKSAMSEALGDHYRSLKNHRAH